MIHSYPTSPRPLPAAEPLPHAGMGVASLVMAIVSLVGTVLLFGVMVAAVRTFHPPQSDETPFNYLMGAWLFATGLLSVCGIVFGMGGLRQANRRRGVAMLGLCLNIAIPMGLMFLLLVALTLREPTAVEATSAAEVPAAAGPPAWQSPGARVFQCLTAVLGAVVCTRYFVRRRRALNLGPGLMTAITSTACPRCGKQVPGDSAFCRRCGTAVHGPIDARLASRLRA